MWSLFNVRSECKQTQPLHEAGSADDIRKTIFIYIVSDPHDVARMWLLYCLVILVSTTALAGPLDTSLTNTPFIIIAQKVDDVRDSNEFSDQKQSSEKIQIVTPSSSISQVNIKKTTPKPPPSVSSSSISSSSSSSASSSSEGQLEHERVLSR